MTVWRRVVLERNQVQKEFLSGERTSWVTLFDIFRILFGSFSHFVGIFSVCFEHDLKQNLLHPTGSQLTNKINGKEQKTIVVETPWKTWLCFIGTGKNFEGQQ